MATATQPTLDTSFIVGEREFQSRLMVGTGKYPSNAVMVQAIEASGAEVVTVAVRRTSRAPNVTVASTVCAPSDAVTTYVPATLPTNAPLSSIVPCPGEKLHAGVRPVSV